MPWRRPPEDDLERPASFLEARLLALVESHPEKVVEVLEPIVSDERRSRIEEVLDARTRSVVVILDRLSDPHNAAAVLRTAEALGLQEVHTIDAAGKLPLARRVTQGCHKWLDLFAHEDAGSCAESLRRRGYRLLAATERAPRAPEDHADADTVALCVGNEHFGLSEELSAECEGTVGIPMRGFTRSLNVSVATGLLLFSLVRDRKRGISGRERAVLKARYYAQSVRAVRELLERRGLLDGPRG